MRLGIQPLLYAAYDEAVMQGCFFASFLRIDIGSIIHNSIFYFL